MARDNWVFSYAGIDMPPPDGNGLGLELQPIDDAERNANGDLLLEGVALKRKLTASWGSLSGEEAHKLFSMLENNRTGTLKYFDIAKNEINEIDSYYGAGAKIGYFRYDDELKRQLYYSVSINFIEM